MIKGQFYGLLLGVLVVVAACHSVPVEDRSRPYDGPPLQPRVRTESTTPIKKKSSVPTPAELGFLFLYSTTGAVPDPDGSGLPSLLRTLRADIEQMGCFSMNGEEQSLGATMYYLAALPNRPGYSQDDATFFRSELRHRILDVSGRTPALAYLRVYLEESLPKIADGFDPNIVLRLRNGDAHGSLPSEIKRALSACGIPKAR